ARSAVQVGAAPRQAVRAVGQGPHGEDLVQVDPVVAEAVGAAGQVQAPDAQDLRVHQLGGFVQARLQVGAPELQGARVVQAQAFHVDHLQALLAHLGDGQGQVRQLAVGEDVAADELAGAATDL